MTRSWHLKRFASIVACAFITVVMAACSVAPQTQQESPASTGASESSTGGAPASAAPSWSPSAPAESNRMAVDALLRPLFKQGGVPASRDVVDTLVEHGIDKAAIQVTPDRTPTDLQADTVQVAVAVNGECVVGQFMPDEFLTEVMQPVAGTCLLGETMPIDW